MTDDQVRGIAQAVRRALEHGPELMRVDGEGR
jgi:hypothetical protein